MAALDRAVALAERDHVAVPVCQELDLDVTRSLEVALAEDGVVAERGGGLAPRCGEGFVELLRRAHDAHSAAAASGRGFDEQRKADLLRCPARQHGHAGRACRLLRGELVAAGAQRGRRRADPDQSGLEHGLGELRALGKESVARMDGVGSGFTSGTYMFGGIEVGGDLDERVRRGGMERAAIVGRRDGDRLDALGAAGTEDAQRDLPTVRDEQPAHGD